MSPWRACLVTPVTAMIENKQVIVYTYKYIENHFGWVSIITNSIR